MATWAKDAVFYQIYPTSFFDANNDGVGDFKGMEEKLDYVKSLGVDAVWLNPFYLSPFMDGGYDIEDYYSVDPRFGTMADFESFMKKATSLGIKVVIDLVIGHTSLKNKWFLESAKDERNEYSDWYIWTDSNFTKYKDKTIHGLFNRDGGYMINYYACQPALNFGWVSTEPENVDPNDPYNGGEAWKIHYLDERLVPLRMEIIKIMRFWMEKGVSGFRVDMASSLVKGSSYESEDPELIKGIVWLWNQLIPAIKKDYPDVFFVAEWVNPRVSVGECGFDSDFILHDTPCYNDLFRNEKGSNLLRALERGHSYFHKDGKGSVDEFIKEAYHIYEKTDGKGYFTAPSGNHDEVRIGVNRSQADLKVVFAFLLTFRHLPFIYYGDELGLTHNFNINKDGGFIRTGSRTPMQWTNGKNRGFSEFDGELYLPVNDDKDCSVESQEKDEKSLLNTVKALLKLRKEYSCLNAENALNVVTTGYPFVYERTDGEKTVIIALNPSSEFKQIDLEYKKVLMSENSDFDGKTVTLKGQSFAILLK